MKGWVIIALALSVAAALVGCGGQSSSGNTRMNNAPSGADIATEDAGEFFGASEIFDAEEDFNAEEYNKITERGFVSPLIAPLSTFASSVDTASYSLIRAKLRDGGEVSPDMVRLEEFVNYFTYDYDQPGPDAPLAINAELGRCPWADGHLLLQVGVQAEKIDMADAPPSNLVFLIDVSGSMYDSNKLPLVQQSFLLLTENLRATDRVSVVTYANGRETLLNGASGESKPEIMSAIESLEANGSDEEVPGIDLKYQQRNTTPSDDLLNIAVRYKLPNESESSRIDRNIVITELSETLSDNMLWASAVAEFALFLRQSEFAAGANVDGALELAASADCSDPYRAEFVEILESY